MRGRAAGFASGLGLGLVMAAGLMLMQATSRPVADAVDLAAGAAGLTGLRSTDLARMADLLARAADTRLALGTAEAERDTARKDAQAAGDRLASALNFSDMLVNRITVLEAEAATPRPYRDAPATAAQAIEDTLARVTARAAVAARREAATAAAEALPVLGSAVIAEAKSARLRDDCADAADWGALWQAVTDAPLPAAAEALCARAAPDARAIRTAIATPAGANAAWVRARRAYPALPDLAPGAALAPLRPMEAAIHDWAFGAHQGPTTPGTSLPRAGNEADFNPLGWYFHGTRR